jgi:DNA modification methylase
MGADTFGDAAGKLVATTHEYDDSADSFKSLMKGVAPLISKVCKPQAHLYVCCDIDQFHFLRQLFNENGWQVFRTPLINVKQGGGRVPLPEHGPRRCYETILYAHRGGKRVTAIYPDVIETRGDENLGHGAQKPAALFEDLLRRSTGAGGRVVDPFAGTGTIFESAHLLRCAATGIELDPAYYGIAAKRIEELQ